MVIGIHLLYALLAGVAFWGVSVLLAGRINAALVEILRGAALVYVFWLLLTYGPITVGR